MRLLLLLLWLVVAAVGIVVSVRAPAGDTACLGGWGGGMFGMGGGQVRCSAGGGGRMGQGAGVIVAVVVVVVSPEPRSPNPPPTRRGGFGGSGENIHKIRANQLLRARAPNSCPDGKGSLSSPCDLVMEWHLLRGFGRRRCKSGLVYRSESRVSDS